MHFLSQLNVPHIQGGFFTLAGEDSQPHMNVAHYSMHSVQFISVAQSRPTLCNPMNRSAPGFPVHHQLPEFTSYSLNQWCHPAISSSIVPFSSCPLSFPASGCFPVSWLLASCGQSIGAFSLKPSKEYSGLISFRIDWSDLLAVQGTLKRLWYVCMMKFYTL